MPYLIERSVWGRQPPPGPWSVDRAGWWGANLRSVINTDDTGPWESLRGMRIAPSAVTGRSVRARRGQQVGPYATLFHTNSVSWSFGFPNSGLSATSSFTLLAVLPGSGRTAVTVRAQVTTAFGGFAYPALLEGDGTNNYWGVRVRVAPGTNVDAYSTVLAPNDGLARVLVVRYTNGVGADLFLDGELIASAATTANLNATANTLQPMSGVAGVDPAVLSAVWSYSMPDHLIRLLSGNPWQMLRPRERVVSYSLGGGAPTLTINDITHAHLVDAIALSQVHQLAAQEATHGQSVDAIALTQTHQLAVDEATHAHPVDSPVVDQAHQLTVSDTLHGHAVDTLDITQVHQLVVQDATHAHPTDAIALTQQHLIAVANCLHQHALDHLSLSGVVTLAIQDILHGHAADGLVLGGSSTLQISDVLHAHAADAVALGQVHVLVVSDAVHAQLVDAVALSLPGAVLAGERALVIPTETRALVVVAETRALAIAAEVRALTIH